MWEPQITTLVTVCGGLWSIVCTQPLWCVNYGLAQSVLSNGDPKGTFSMMIENPHRYSSNGDLFQNRG